MKKGLAGKLIGSFVALSVIAAIVFTILAVNDAKREGAEYAQNRTKLDCLNEVTKGDHICVNTSCFLNNRYFYQSCIDSAAESPELCDPLPEIRMLIRLEMWKKKQCDNLGRKDRNCHHIWLKALEVCGK